MKQRSRLRCRVRQIQFSNRTTNASASGEQSSAELWRGAKTIYQYLQGRKELSGKLHKTTEFCDNKPQPIRFDVALISVRKYEQVRSPAKCPHRDKAILNGWSGLHYFQAFISFPAPATSLLSLTVLISLQCNFKLKARGNCICSEFGKETKELLCSGMVLDTDRHYCLHHQGGPCCVRTVSDSETKSTCTNERG